jgi:hypothetical protein
MANKYDVKQKLIVKMKGKKGSYDHVIPSGLGIAIPSEVLDDWFVKAHIENGNITISGAKKIEAAKKEDGKTSSVEAKKIISAAKEEAKKIVSAAKEEADTIIAEAKEEAEMLNKAAEEAALQKVQE